MNSKKLDKKIIKEYLSMRYPILAWDHNLDATYDYIGMQCWEFLHNYKNLESEICNFSEEEKNKIEKAIQNYMPLANGIYTLQHRSKFETNK